VSVIARVSFLNRQIASIDDSNLPIELDVAISWTHGPRSLVVVDQLGSATVFDFRVVPLDEATYGAFSIRVSRSGAFQADCLLGRDSVPIPSDFLEGKVLGIRLQPILLPGVSATKVQTAGRGTFARGLHYPGILTRSNVSLLCICDGCRASFRLQPFHSGFGQSEYFYCETGTHTLLINSKVLSSLTESTGNLPSRPADLEKHLPPCDVCQSAFRYLNPLRCPQCHTPYIDFHLYPESRPQEYYGNFFYGTKLQVISEPQGNPDIS